MEIISCARGNKVTMTDKESGETVFIEIEDINNAILTLEDGTITEYQRRSSNFETYYTNGCTNT